MVQMRRNESCGRVTSEGGGEREGGIPAVASQQS